MVRTRLFLGAVMCLTATAPAFGAILEEGNVFLSQGLNEVGSASRGPGDGSLWITPPSVLAGSTLRIATGFTSSGPRIAGNVYVQGGAINLTQDILLSDGGIGLLEVTGGGLVDASLLTLAGPTTALPNVGEATMVLDGAGTKMRIKQKTTFGETGFAEIFIKNGALLQTGTQTPNQQVIIANRTSSVGTVKLDGPSSAWQHNGPIVVGNFGTGSLHVTGGANLTSTGGALGGMTEGPQSSLGSVLLEGEDTRWITGNLTIGDRGVGELRVLNGALLELSNLNAAQVLGNQSGSFGRLIVSGPNSRWVNSQPTTIGGSGAGEVWIENGAIVSNGGATLAQSSSMGSGLAVVRGEHTRWHAASMIVGAEGRAQLRIEDGATVAVGPFSRIGSPRTGSQGRLTLDNGTFTLAPNQVFENRGIIEGRGIISAMSVNNVQNGQVLVREGDLLEIAGNLASPQTGRIEIINGELGVSGSFNNSSQSRVVSDGGTLRVRGQSGFLNLGTAQFTGLNNRVIGYTNNQKSIVVAGNSDLTFDGDVYNASVIKASEGASLTVLGKFSGMGVTGPGDVFLEGTVAPGQSPGVMNFGGNVTLGDLSELTMEFSESPSGLAFDQLDVNDVLQLSGSLNLQALTRLTQAATVTIATASEVFGEFSSVPELGADIGYGVQFNGITYDYQSDAVTVSLLPSPPLAGDYDGDGSVDGADFLAWQRQLGDTATAGGADGNGDGAVDGADLEIWQQGFAANAAADASSLTAVPEPGAATLILVGFLGLVGRRVIGRTPLRL